VLDFRQGLIDAKEDHQDFAIYSNPQRPQDEKEHALPQVLALTGLKLGGSIDNHNGAGDETEDGADPEQNLDDDRGNHSPESPKVAHEDLLLRLGFLS
jgi:hypothetical protein